MEAVKTTIYRGITVFLTLVLTSCAAGILPTQESTAAPKSAWVLVTADPDSTPTPTPFRPLGQTPTPQATNTPTVTPTPVITETPTEEPILFPNPSQNVLNILLLGSDQRADSGFRTDVIMLVSIHAEDNSVRVVSFPRDLYISIPGYGSNRINTVMQLGGFPLMVQTFEQNFNVHPDRYIMVNFQGVIDIVDDLDGITIEAEKPLYDSCDLPQQDGNGKCDVEIGPNTMDGKTVLWYVRSRHTSSDFDRMRRTQEVMKALFSRLFTAESLRKIPEFYSLFSESVDTNMSLEDALPYIPVAIHMQDANNIRRYVVGTGMVWDYIVPESGAWVLLPNLTAINSMVSEAIYGP